MIRAFEGKTPNIAKSAYVATNVTLIGDVNIGDDASIWFQSVLRADINSISIGAKTNIQDGCMLHITKKHPLVVGERVTVGHGAILHGCTIASDCLIAMGTIILDGAVIEERCIIGAGTVVPPGMTIKSGSLALGSPAKVIRELTRDDIERIDQGWRNYIDYARRFALSE